MTNAIVFPSHRSTARDYYEQAFSSGKEVVYLSIMSQRTLLEIEPRLDCATRAGTRLRILTLDPAIGEQAVRSICLHLNENTEDPARTAAQIQGALEEWTRIAAARPALDIVIKKYRSAPTSQAILVRDEFLLLELLPYATSPAERPGLLFTPEANADVFSLLQTKYLQLWADADPV